MSDTPRTDKVMRESSADAGFAWLEMRDHARQLERELITMNELIDALIDLLEVIEDSKNCRSANNNASKLREKIAKWRAYNDRHNKARQ